METNHTPGPWYAKHHGDWIVGRDEEHGEVVVAKAGHNWEANANLIAAAPDLLCMLNRLLDGVLRLHAIPDTFCPLDIEQARAAIAKAEGKQ